MAALSAERAGNDHVDHEGGPAGGSLITMRCIGQSVGTEAELRAQLHPLALEAPSSLLMVKSLGFLDAVKHFAGPLDYESVFMKAKSDYGDRGDAGCGRRHSCRRGGAALRFL
jgi:hypothetical protein